MPAWLSVNDRKHPRRTRVSGAATTSFDLDRFCDPFWAWMPRRILAWRMRALIRAIVRVVVLVGLRSLSGRPAAILDAEQKCQIVSESLEPGVTPSEVARRHGIGTGQLYTWRRQMVGVQRAVSTQSGPALRVSGGWAGCPVAGPVAGISGAGRAVIAPNGGPDRDRASLRRIFACRRACRWPRAAPSS